MKKLLALLLSVLMIACCFAGCDNGEKPDNDEPTTEVTTLQDIKDNGKLVIATSPDFPPFENLEGKEVVGIEIEIMELVAEKLGVELEVKTMSFDSVLPAVQAGKYDVGVSGISVTPARQKNVLFTDPYCLAAQAIVVVEGSAIKSKADLEGKKISLQTGTTAETYCMENGYNTQKYQANTDAQLALVNGKVDAWVIDDLTAAEMVATYNAKNKKKLVILDDAMTTEPYAFAFKLGNDELVAEVNKIINELVADGTVAEIFEEYDAPYTSPSEK